MLKENGLVPTNALAVTVGMLARNRPTWSYSDCQ